MNTLNYIIEHNNLRVSASTILDNVDEAFPESFETHQQMLDKANDFVSRFTDSYKVVSFDQPDTNNDEDPYWVFEKINK